MDLHDFLESTLPIPAKHLWVQAHLTRGLRAAASTTSVAVCFALTLAVGAACAGTVAGQGDARFEPRRPAPVTGRVGNDAPTAVAPQAVSTAVQVPAPAHLPAAPHDLLAQAVASPATPDGKDLGRMDRAARTPVAKVSKTVGARQQPAMARAAPPTVSRETASGARSKAPRSRIARHERDGKGPQTLAERRAAKAHGTTATQHAHAKAAHASRAATTAHQKPARALAGRPSGALSAKAGHQAKAVARVKSTAKHQATRMVTHAAKPAKPAKAAQSLKHTASVRSAKAAPSGTASAARRHGV
jgi:hypothetical protein